jgi:hypothetical protein
MNSQADWFPTRDLMLSKYFQKVTQSYRSKYLCLVFGVIQQEKKKRFAKNFT